jgi:hypothetical protein
LTGDVDGDGTDDKVSLFADPEGDEGCGAFLVVEAASTIVASVWEVGEVAGLPQPSLQGLRDVDGAAGFEIIVNEAAGASTQFVAVYRVQGDAIERFEFAGEPEDMFAFGGSVGHVEAVDCSAETDVVVSTAVPAPGEEALEKGLYRVVRTLISYDGVTPRVEDKQVHEVLISDLDRFPEYANSPFGTCAAP